jgi:hypothetical protein
MSHLAETNPAKAKLADIASRPSADSTPVVLPHFELRRTLLLFDQAFLCQLTNTSFLPLEEQERSLLLLRLLGLSYYLLRDVRRDFLIV